MLGCRNCGQPRLPNATTAASLRAWGGPEAGGGSPLTQAGFSPQVSQSWVKGQPRIHAESLSAVEPRGYVLLWFVFSLHQEFRNEA